MKVIVVFVACLASFASAEWSEHMENAGLYQGDMVLTPEQHEEAEKGTFQFASTKGRQWPGGKIAYTMDSGIARSSRAVNAINAAIADYHKYTCLRFHKRTNERAYIHFYVGGGCSSPVGYTGRRNSISLAGGCWHKGTVMHEIGHSIGLFHEQSRPDRDSYVTILWNNISPSNMKFNFNKQPASNIDSLGTKYDYRSMMHYGKTAFGRGRVTIQTKDPSMQNVIGQRGGFSSIDIQQINLLYKRQCGGGGPVPTSGPTNCSDNHRNCAYWANRGECRKNPRWMLVNCKKSCRQC